MKAYFGRPTIYRGFFQLVAQNVQRHLYEMYWPQRKSVNHFFTIEIETSPRSIYRPFLVLINGFLIDSSLLKDCTWWKYCCISYNYDGSSKSFGLIDLPSYIYVISVFTGGSKTETGTGSGIFSDFLDIPLPLRCSKEN